MKHRNQILSMAMLLALVTAGLAGKAATAQDDGPTSTIKFVVVRDANGKPVKSAQIVLHAVNRKGKASKEEMELKTNEDGRASIDSVPYGSVEVQVLAPGFQTFGEDYEVKQAELEITIKLKRPSGQYSTYDNHDEKKASDQKPQ